MNERSPDGRDRIRSGREVLRRAGVPRTSGDEPLDRFTRLAAGLLRAPLALLSVGDAEGLRIASQVGLPDPWRVGDPLPPSGACAQVLAKGECITAGDLRTDEHLREMASALGMLSYVGCPLRLSGGAVAGVLAAMDARPREWSAADLAALSDLAASAVTELEWRHEVTTRSETERALKESEERYRLMVEGSEQVFFYEHDPEHRFTYLSPSVEAVLGYSPEELLGRPYDVLLSGGEEAEEVHQKTTGALSTGNRAGAYTALTLHRDGRTVAVELVETPLVRDGRVVGMQGFARDITQRRRAEEALRESEAHFRSVVETLGEGLVITDLEGVTVYVNSRFGEILGYAPKELVGRPAYEMLLAPVEQTRYRERLGERRHGRSERYELPMLRRGGERVWVEVHAVPYRDASGQVVGTLAAIADITERRRAQAALRQSEAHFRSLIEHSSDVIDVLDADGTFRYVSPSVEHVLGYAPEELVGRNVLEILHPEDRPRVHDAFLARTPSGERFRTLEVRILHKSGSWRTFEAVTRNLLRDPTVAGLVVNSRDITEHRVQEEQLRRAERLASVGTLISGVAHELNNPLTAVKNFAQLLLLDPRPAEDREALEIMHREATRAAKIVSDLRMVARETQQSGSREAVDLNEVVRHILRLRRYVLQTHNVRVEEALAPELPPVRADRAQLEQVVLNLVINAEQAMHSGEEPHRLRVWTELAEGEVRLGVEDSGCGIPAELQRRIFDPFFTTKEPGEGTGLGLSLVHSIVSEHGGEIRLESAPDRGATFLVSLPLLAAAPIVADGREITPTALRPLRVLVVDDEAPIRRSLARYLRRRGHHVEEAADGGEALQRIRDAGAQSYDIVLTDLRMPGLNGEQLFARLQQEESGLLERVVFVTGDAASPDAARRLTSCGAPVVLKPFELPEIAQVVEWHAETATSGSRG